ncbi:MAG: tetratricopeptide repeat protein [Anaerolineae bacterium]|jgi:tetratricopeptide (TPR) repeat protein
MYIGPHRKKRQPSWVLIILLLVLIAAGLYVLEMISRGQIERPFEPTPIPTRSAFFYADEAEDWYQQGNLDEAIASYEQVLALDPADVNSLVKMARLLVLRERPVEAVRLAQRATEMSPENAQAWAVLGMAYDWNGDVSRAIDACKRAIDLDPTYARAYAYLSEAYTDAVRWTEAREAVELALQLDDHDEDVYRNYGYMLENQGDYTGAIAAYERALEIHPNLAYIHIAVGRNYRALGDFEAAASSFQRATEIDPSDAKAYDQLGWTYYGMGEYEQAETYLKKAIEADTEFGQAFGHLAINYWSRRNWEDAIPNFERAIDLACAESRRQVGAFYITVEEVGSEIPGPSPTVVMRGDFVVASEDDQDTLRAVLRPKNVDDDAWTDAQGTVTLNARTGQYTLKLQGVPRARYGQVYAGWFEGINTLSGDPLSTGSFALGSDGDLEAEFETGWVDGPRIEYFYTLGLAYFYKGECEKSYPLFYAALQIDPADYSALEGIRLCQEAEAEEGGS